MIRFTSVYFSHALLLSSLAAFVCLLNTAAFADDAATLESKVGESAAAGTANSAKVRVGSPFPRYTLEDQHGKQHTLDPSTKTVLISTNMELSKAIHVWLNDKHPTYLTDNKIEYVSDITSMPGIISWMFAKPKMRKFPFQILLADDNGFAPQFPQEEGKLAVFQLSPDRTVADLKFVTSMDELQALLPPVIPQSGTSVSVVNEAAVGAVSPSQIR